MTPTCAHSMQCITIIDYKTLTIITCYKPGDGFGTSPQWCCGRRFRSFAGTCAHLLDFIRVRLSHKYINRCTQRIRSRLVSRPKMFRGMYLSLPSMYSSARLKMKDQWLCTKVCDTHTHIHAHIHTQLLLHHHRHPKAYESISYSHKVLAQCWSRLSRAS